MIFDPPKPSVGLIERPFLFLLAFYHLRSYTNHMKNLIIDGANSGHLLFSLLLPISVVAEIYAESDDSIVDAMMRCKSQFDMAIMRCRGIMQDGDISVDGVILGR